MLAAAAADVDTEFGSQWRQAALQRADDAGGDARGMPVHSHDRAERLEPERMRQPLQEFVTAIVMNDRLCDDRAERGHPRCQPWRYAAAMQGKIGAAGTSCHGIALLKP